MATKRIVCKDAGIVLRHGDGPNECDRLGAREAIVNVEKGIYYLFYDGAGNDGWRACLAISKDLQTWVKKGPVLQLGKPGDNDAKSASSPWVIKDGDTWHMFYLGTPNASPPPDRIPSFPYLTMKARAAALDGPWTKQYGVVPFLTKENTFYAATASPGYIVPYKNRYVQFFSGSAVDTLNKGTVKRTLGIATTGNLDGPWQVQEKPIVPPEEQVENSSVYFEDETRTWFLFTNHIGINASGTEYTDAVWAYWSTDLFHWDAGNKAIVLDNTNCRWSKGAIGMPSVVRVGNRLALLYDGFEGFSTGHMKRDIGLAWIELPIKVVGSQEIVSSHHTQENWGTSPIREPYPYIASGGFTGVGVAQSPDPLVAYRWPSPGSNDGLEIYLQKPGSVTTDAEQSFENLESLTGPAPDVSVRGTGSIRLDFGRVSAAWLEFDSPDLKDSVQMSISEFNAPARANVYLGPAHPFKTAVPVKYGNTYRLELNSEYYEGVRFGWIHVRSFHSPWHITGIRLVCQTKPANYNGNFSCSDTMLTRIWYAGAYTVKLNLMKDYFGSVLLDRGDRRSWTGDAYIAQAASLVAFANYDFIKKNIVTTANDNNGIRSYSLYWVLGLLDYFSYTGDTAFLSTYLENACTKLDDAYKVFGTNPALGFYGWDERLGFGFEEASCPESQNAYKMLSIGTWREFAETMGKLGRIELRAKYIRFATEKLGLIRENAGWFKDYGLHASADAIRTGLLSGEEQHAMYRGDLSNRINRVSFSPFNQFFVIQAFARMNKYDDALGTIRDLWGGQVKYGGTTAFEVYRPSWNDIVAQNGPLPNNQAGYTSLCHPWSAGVTKWLSEEVLGIKPTSPGFARYDIVPHLGRTLTRVAGAVPTPAGVITAFFDVAMGICSISAPPGTVGRIGIPKVEKRITAITVGGRAVWDGKYHPVTGIGGALEDSAFIYFTHVQPGKYALEIAYRGTTPKYMEPTVHYPASFVKEDSITKGNWSKAYGKDGYILFGCNSNNADKAALPTYISSVTYPASGFFHPNSYVWELRTDDERALSLDAGNVTERRAACLYSFDVPPSFTLNVSAKDSLPYQVALYFVDWDDKKRLSAVEILDAASLNLIAPVRLVKSFYGGKYLVFSCNKSVKIRIEQVQGKDAVLSGVFFDRG